MAVKYAANVGEDSISIDGEDLTGAFGAGSEFALVIPNHGTPSIAWQTVFSAPVGSITVLLEASLNGSDWFTIDTSTSISGEIRTISGSYRFLRINNSAVTVGAGITLTASFVYSNTSGLYPLIGDPLPIYTTQVTLAQADLTALSGATKVILAGIPGYVIVPVASQWDRLAGNAYTLNGVTQIGVFWAGSFISTYSNTSGLVDAAGPVSSIHQVAPGSAASVYVGLTPAQTTLQTGNGLVASRTGGTDLSGGTGSVVVTLWYRKYKVPQP